MCLVFSDYSKGFGGKYGKQESMDKSAVGYEHQEKLQLHESQKGIIAHCIKRLKLYCY